MAAPISGPGNIIDHFVEIYKSKFSYALSSIKLSKKKRERLELERGYYRNCDDTMKINLLADKIFIKESIFIGADAVTISGTEVTISGTFNSPVEIVAIKSFKIEASNLAMRNVDLKFLPTTLFEFKIENFSIGSIHFYTILTDEATNAIRELFLQKCDSLDEFYFQLGKNRLC